MPEDSPHRPADVAVSHTGTSVTLAAPAGGVTLTVDEAQELAGRLVEASARAGGQNPDENDWVRIPMQYIRVTAGRLEGEEFAEGEENLGDAKTAEVHCWIRGQTQRNAMHVAAGWIADHGWFIEEVIEQAAVTADDFAGSEYLAYYEQALVDSEVFLYEIDDGEADEGPADPQ